MYIVCDLGHLNYTIFLNRFIVKGLHNCFYLWIIAATSLFSLQYISEMYHEDPEAYTKECNEFDQLRQVGELL